MRRLVLVTMTLAIANPALADLTMIDCDDPAGFHVYHGPGLTSSEPYERNHTTRAESFGTEPKFILDPSRPKTLIVLWGSYTPKELPEELVDQIGLHAEAVEAEIVSRDEHHITAVRTLSAGAYLYTLYPKLGYGIFSRHIHQTSGKAAGYTYFGLCRFP